MRKITPKNSQKSKNSGFTLVEIVIVIAVIAILAAVLIPTFSTIIMKAKVSNDNSTAHLINMSIALYRAEGKEIEDLGDLRDAVNNATHEDFFDSLAPESAQYGYHFWLDMADPKRPQVIVARAEDVLPEESETLAVNPLPRRPVLMRQMVRSGGMAVMEEALPEALKVDDAVSTSFMKRMALVTGNKFLMDRIGSDIAEAMAALSSHEMNSEQYQEAIEKVVALAEKNHRYDAALSTLYRGVLETTAFVTNNGTFRYAGTVPENLVFADGITFVSGILWEYSQSEQAVNQQEDRDTYENIADVFGTVILPETVQEVDCNGLNLGKEVTIFVNRGENELDKLFFADSTNSKIVYPGLEDDKHLEINGGTMNEVTTDKVTGEVTKREPVSVNLSAGTKVTDFTIYLNGEISNTNLFFAADTLPGELVFTAKDFIGENEKIPSNTAITWSVSNTTAADVASGKVTFTDAAKSADTIILTAKPANGDVEKTITIHIVRITTITLNSSGIAEKLTAEQAKSFTASVTAAGFGYNFPTADEREDCSTALTYESSDESVFTVDEKGSIRFVGFGTARLTVTLQSNSSVSTSIEVKFEEEISKVLKKKFDGSFLYRLGNANNFNLSYLFGTLEGVNTTGITYTVNVYDASKTDGSGNRVLIATSGSFYGSAQTINGLSTLEQTYKFNDTGVAIIEITAKKDGKDIQTIGVAVEVVNGQNAASSMNATASNVILLCDISTGGLKVSGGYTLFGNGFKVTDTRTPDQTKNDAGWIAITNGYVDNAQLLGQHFPDAVVSGTSNRYYQTTARIDGGGIYNSLITGSRFALHVRGGDVEIVNTTIDGGAVANIKIQGIGTTVLDNVTTIQRSNTNAQLFGLGIWVESDSNVITLKNALNQFNWGTKTDATDIPSDYRTLVNELFSGADFADFRYTADGTTYINTGILFFNENETLDGSNLTNLNAQGIFMLNGVTYTSVTKTTSGMSARIYSYNVAKSGNPTNVMDYPKYNTAGQHHIQPTLNLNITNDNTDSRQYYSYDKDAGILRVGFKSEVGSITIPAAAFAPYASKFGTTIPVSVTMNGIDYTGKGIPFSAEGQYTIKLTYTDRNNYNTDLSQYDVTYEEELSVIVTAVEPDAKHADFTFIDPAGTKYEATTVVIDGKTYVMPNVSATTSEKIMSTTVNGVTVYAPYVVTLYKDNRISQDFNYIYPLLTGINVTDYADGKPNGATTTYSSSTSEKTIFSQGGNTKFNVVSDTAVWNYAVGTTKMEFTYGSSYGGLYLLAGAKGSDITARGFFGEFSYTDNAGATYYYFIYYHMPAHNKPTTCITPETLITLADGTQKQVQHLTGEEQLLVWNHETGKLDTSPVSFIINHDGMIDDQEVITLRFDTGDYVEIIGNHVFFDMTDNKYVGLESANVDTYIGHSFAVLSDDGLVASKLIEVTKEIRTTGVYEVGSHNTVTCFTNNVLSSVSYLDPLLNAFEINKDTLAYDHAQMEKDIEKYGLLSYDDVRDLIPEKDFYMFGMQYYSIAVGKGYTTWEEVYMIFEVYASSNPKVFN